MADVGQEEVRFNVMFIADANPVMFETGLRRGREKGPQSRGKKVLFGGLCHEEYLMVLMTLFYAGNET